MNNPLPKPNIKNSGPLIGANSNSYKDKFNKMVSTSSNANLGMALMLITKMLLFVASYFSLVITTNYMSNAYINDTLIEKKEAPSLINYGLMYTFINLIFSSIVYFTAMFMINSLNLEVTIYDVLIDILLYLVMSCFIVIVIANAMQSKRYFLYEDDGLRANRALKDIMIVINIGLVLLPYNKLVK